MRHIGDKQNTFHVIAMIFKEHYSNTGPFIDSPGIPLLKIHKSKSISQI